MAVAYVNPNVIPITVQRQDGDVVTIDSIELAQTYMENTKLDAQDIRWQLGETRRRHPVEDRDLNETEMHEWRQKARKALIHKERLIVQLKQYIRAELNVYKQTRQLLMDGRDLVVNGNTINDAESRWVQAVDRHLELSAELA